MTIIVKNKVTLIYDDFIFKCSIGGKGFTKNKVESDQKTPRGTFQIGNLYFRNDRNKKPKTKLKCIPIKKIWVGVTTLTTKNFIINCLKLKKVLNMKNFLGKIKSTIF